MKPSLILLSAYLLVAIPAKPQTPALDNMVARLAKLPDDTAKAAVLLHLVNEFNSYDLGKALACGQEGTALAQRLGDENLLPHIQMALGRSHANRSQPASALHYFYLAKTGFEKKRGHERRGFCAFQNALGTEFPRQLRTCARIGL